MRLLPFAVALLGAVVAGVLTSPLGPQAERLLVPAWLLALALFLVSVLGAEGWRPGSFRALRETVRANAPEIAQAGLLVLLAFALRTVDLSAHPYPFVNDEGATGLAATAILAGEHPNLFGTGWSGVPLIGFLPYGASILAFGRTVLALRAVSAVEGTLGVLLVYLLGRQVAGRAVGFLAAAFAATLPLHLHFSRLGFSNVVDSFTGPLVLGLTLRAVRKGRLADHVWAGLASGAAVYVYLGSRLVVALAVGVLAWEVVRERRLLKARRVQLLAFAAAFLFVAGPIAAYFAKRPDDFMGRINSQSILHNGWLQGEALRTGRSPASLLGEQFSRTVGAYVADPATDGFFNSSRPYLFPVAALFCFLGMAVAVFRIRDTGHLLLVVWFWAVVILGSTLMVCPPSSERLIQSVTPLSILFGLGVWSVAKRLARPGAGNRPAVAFAAVAALVTGFLGARYYFGEYRSRGCFGNPVDEAIQEISREANRLGNGYDLYLIGVPAGCDSIPNFRYLIPDVPRRDVERATPELVASLPAGRGAFFAALGPADGTLRAIAGLVPGGEWKRVRRAVRDEVCYSRYVVPPGRLAETGPPPGEGPALRTGGPAIVRAP